ncbi:MAG: ATP synthase F0 subunit C [Oligoflexia bacterium]|nr:ATP synthase F0 subunit C [Oligoflexia bacterium]
MRIIISILSLVALATLSIAAALASDGGAATTAATAAAGTFTLVTEKAFMGAFAVVGVGIAAAGGGVGQGLIASKALEGISRNPAAIDKIFTPMILTIAFVESLVIFTIVTIFLVK